MGSSSRRWYETWTGCGSDGRYPRSNPARWRENAAVRKLSLRRGIALAKIAAHW
jgi:hypothetical protein